MSVTFWAAVGSPPGIQNGITAYTCTPCSSSRCTNSQKSGRVCSKVLSRKAYYSCQVSRICVAAVSVETRALETDSTIAVDRVEPCTHESAVQPVSPLSRHSGQGFCSFSSKLLLVQIIILAIGWLAKILAATLTPIGAPSYALREYTYG